MRCWHVSAVAFVAAGLLACSSAARSAELPADYRALRRDLLLVLPVAPSREGRGLRKEIAAYLTRLTAFIQETEKTAPECQPAAYYFRGRVQMKLRRLERAREDFDHSLAGMQGTATLAPGTPRAADVQVYRAFTFAAEGHEKVLAELESIPADTESPSYHEVGPLLCEWADSLVDAGQDALARRALQFIQKHDLWHDEAEDPRPKIDRLDGRTGQGAAAAAAPDQGRPAAP